MPCPSSRLRAALLRSLPALLFAAPLAAQTPPPTAQPDETLTLPTLGVSAPGATDGYQTRRSTSATRTDTPLRDIPQSVNVVTQQAIRDLSMQSLQDVMRYVPGAGFSQGEGNRDTPVLRGQSTTASLFVDGIRDDAQYYRDLYNIDRVETLLGPSGMIFGRGGAGGIINRVTRQADWERHREVRLQAGSFGDYRGAFDVGDAVNEHAAYRVMGMYEASDSFRDGVTLRRSGINPTAAFRTTGGTLLRISYENFRDERTADRGIPSFSGRPFATARGNFFGDPNISPSHVNLNAVGVYAEHDFDRVTLRNQFRFAAYDKFYQNVFASGAVNAAGTSYTASAYNNSQKRDNFFNQTDVITRFTTGPIRHELLTGLELASQQTDNVRLTGYFTSVGPNATSVTASVFAPRINLPVAFRPSATDANNSGTATTVALYVQDQVRLTEQWQIVAGVRFENFNVDFTNNRNGQNFNVTNNFVSPRVGLIYKPVEPVSLYASYSQSYLPRAGEQLASLTLSNANLAPEGFTNYEVGAKWDIRPDLSVTAALFRLDRTNVAVTNPVDVTQLTLVNGTRTKGVEIGVRGRVTDSWSVMGGYAYTEGEILGAQSATIRSGNTTPFLSRNTVSLWNRYDFQPELDGYSPRLGVALGIINQSSYFAAADNAVRIPGFTRFDAAAFWEIKPGLAAQLNFENLLGARYYPVADNNNNISPGAPFAVRGALTARF